MTGFTCTVTSSPRAQVFIASHADVLSGSSRDEPKGRLRKSPRFLFLLYFQRNSLYRAALFANLEGILSFFCPVNHLSGCGVDANHNASLPKKQN